MSRPRSVRETVPRSWRVLRVLAPRLRAEWRCLSTGIGAMLAAVVLRILEPWPLKFVLDVLIDPQRDAETDFGLTLITVSAVAMIAVTSLRALAEYFQSVRFSLVGNRVVTKLRSDLFEHLQRLSLDFHNRSRKGDLTVRVIGDVNIVKDVAVSALLPLLSSVLILVGMVGVMFWMHWKLALLACVALPAFWIFAASSGRQIQTAARKQRQREGALAATATESLASQHVVQALSLQHVFESAFGKQNARSLSEGVRTSRLTARLERVVDVLVTLVAATVLWQGARYTLDGQMSPGELVVFLTYFKRTSKPLQGFAKYTGRLAKATAAGERVIELLAETPTVADRLHASVAPPLAGHIEFHDVDFEYSTSHRVLDGINLSISPGEHIAIVGQSGIGKSTLLSLLIRLFDPGTGAIRIDGTDIREWQLDSLRSQISVVLQDTLLFAGTVRENIAYAFPDATDAMIEDAARLAAAHEFISKLPDGYSTELGERGVNLSHGQRQRIAVARAAVRPSPILLLDEPTTGLDEENERAVIEAIRRLAVGRTTLTVTHNLRLAGAADRTLRLVDGCIADIGSHSDLTRSVDPNDRHAQSSIVCRRVLDASVP